MKRALQLLCTFLVLSASTQAWAVADGMLCKVPWVPEAAQAKPATIYVEDFSRTAPLVALYGYQTMRLEKSTSGHVVELTSAQSLYWLRIDTERQRVWLRPRQSTPRPLRLAGCLQPHIPREPSQELLLDRRRQHGRRRRRRQGFIP